MLVDGVIWKKKGRVTIFMNVWVGVESRAPLWSFLAAISSHWRSPPCRRMGSEIEIPRDSERGDTNRYCTPPPSSGVSLCPSTLHQQKLPSCASLPVGIDGSPVLGAGSLCCVVGPSLVVLARDFWAI